MKNILLLLIVLVSTKSYSQTPITDANIFEAVNTCLSTNPVDGLCNDSEYGAMPDWDVSNVTNMGALFQAKLHFNGDLSGWDVSNVSSMAVMFNAAKAFNSDISDWDVGNVTTMNGMFLLSSAFNTDLSTWDVSKVTQMEKMFWSASAFNGNISGWDVGNVIDMEWMFLDALVFNSDLSQWDVGNVTNMSSMFKNAKEFNADLSDWNVGNVTKMSSMFQNAKLFNADLSAWNFGDVKDFSNIFLGANTFNADLSSWDVTTVFAMGQMFRNSGLSRGNYDAILVGWSQQNVKPNLTLGADGINYCESEAARQSLIDNRGWTINDSGYDCDPVDVHYEDKLSISIYPIPTSGNLNVEGTGYQIKAVVYDMLGREVIEQYITDRIDISHLEKGVYFIQLSDGPKTSSFKIVKN